MTRPTSAGRVTWQLTRVEARRLLRNPYLWTVVIGTVALVYSLQRNQLPNLSEATITAAMCTFLIAAALMVIANLATLRDQREGVPEGLAALPGRADVRTRAIVLASGCLGAGLVTAVIGTHLLVRLTQGPAGGSVEPLELLAAALAAAVMAVTGVALGRWAPSSITAPAVLGVLAIGFFIGPLFLVAWHLPITAPYETQVFGRPVVPRLFYLTAALALVGALALLRHGRRALRLGVVTIAVAAIVPAGIAIAATAPPMGGWVVDQGEPVAGQPDLQCTERNALTYCHFPGFATWIPLWAEAVEPVAAALPPDQRHRMPVIAQHASFGPPLVRRDDRAYVRMVWGRGTAAEDDRGQLAGQIAGLVTGLEDVHTGTAGAPAAWCDARGQARTVVALWLAGHAAPLRPPVRIEPGYPVATDLGSVEYSDAERRYAQALLDRPDARELIWRHWDVLLDPATTVDAARPLLGLTDRFAIEPPTGSPCD
jgi:hypothetical protein